MSKLQKATKKIGFVTSIAILIGSIIGIGIFFKNESVFRANNGNGVYVLISWILAAIISTATAFSFGEACSVKNGGIGIGGWAEQLCGKKIGYFTKFNFAVFYFGVMITAIAIFTSEALLNIFGLTLKEVHIGYVMLLGVAICLILVLFNLFAINASRVTQVVLTSFKFIPIVLIIILGFIFFNTKGNNLFVPQDKNEEIVVKKYGDWSSASVAGILASLPAILFAFDSFTCVGALRNEVKSKKIIPLTIIVGMILVSIVYTLITIVQILIGTGSIGETFNKIFENNKVAKNVFGYIVSISMFLSVLGVANALTISCLRIFDGLVVEKVIVGHNLFAKWSKGKPLIAGSILFAIIGGTWLLIMVTISLIVGHDGYVDAISNYATLFFFGIYGTVILFTLINRFTKRAEVDKLNSYVFYPMAIISILGIALIFGYQFFYENIAKLIINSNDRVSAGVLFGPSDDLKIKVWQNAIVFFVMLILFFAIPIINYYANEKYKKSKSYIDIDYYVETKQNINDNNVDDNIK